MKKTVKNNSDQIHVYYVDPVGGHRGMHYYDFELCQELENTGITMTLLTCDETQNLTIPNRLTVRFPFQKIYGTSPKWLRGLRYLHGLLNIGFSMYQQGIPLGHFHYFHFLPIDYVYFRWLNWIGKRLVFTVHDVIPFNARPSDMDWLNRLYHLADQLIVHAESNLHKLVTEFDVAEGKINIIPMGPYLQFADEQQLLPQLAKQKLGFDPDTPIILFFGQIKTVKGLAFLIKAFKIVSEQLPETRLVIAGPEWNETFDGYANLINELGLADKVLTRIEYVPDEEVGVYFSAATVVALPYTEAYQSAVLYMAYSFAKSVVASAVGGLAEVVVHEQTGWLVPPSNVNYLANTLLAVLQNLEKTEYAGQQARALVEKEFGWRNIAQKTARVYTRTLENP